MFCPDLFYSSFFSSCSVPAATILSSQIVIYSSCSVPAATIFSMRYSRLRGKARTLRLLI